MNRFRFYLATLLSPVVLPIAVLILSLIGHNFMRETHTSFVRFMTVVYLVAGFVAMPVLIAFRAFQITNLRRYLTVGAVFGLLTGLLLYLIFYSDAAPNQIATLGYLAFWIITCVVSALMSWLIRYGFTLRAPTAKSNKSLDRSAGRVFRT
jgi:hypothetical protein